MLYIAIAQLVLIAFLLYDKGRERDHYAKVTADFAQQARDERLILLRRDVTPDLKALIDMNAKLCQRLQAPAQAINEHIQGLPTPPSPQPVDMNDDEAVWESREDLAEKLMALETGV